MDGVLSRSLNHWTLEKEYTTYTSMDEGSDKLWHGDVVIFDGEKVVAYFGQIAVLSFYFLLRDRSMY